MYVGTFLASVLLIYMYRLIFDLKFIMFSLKPWIIRIFLLALKANTTKSNDKRGLFIPV